MSDDLNDYKELPSYRVTDVIPVEDDDGNLIDLELEMVPSNLVAEIMEMGIASASPTSEEELEANEDYQNFLESDKLMEIPEEIVNRIDAFREQYGEKCLIDVEDDEEDEEDDNF